MKSRIKIKSPQEEEKKKWSTPWPSMRKAKNTEELTCVMLHLPQQWSNLRYLPVNEDPKVKCKSLRYTQENLTVMSILNQLLATWQWSCGRFLLVILRWCRAISCSAGKEKKKVLKLTVAASSTTSRTKTSEFSLSVPAELCCKSDDQLPNWVKSIFSQKNLLKTLQHGLHFVHRYPSGAVALAQVPPAYIPQVLEPVAASSGCRGKSGWYRYQKWQQWCKFWQTKMPIHRWRRQRKSPHF